MTRAGKILACGMATLLALVAVTAVHGDGTDVQPSYEHNSLYLHYDEAQPSGQQYWMDASRTNQTKTFSMSVGLTGDFTLDFVLRPSLNHTLLVDAEAQSNLVVRLHLEAEGINPFPLKDVWIEWMQGEATIHSDAPDNVEPGVITFELHLGNPIIASGTQITLRVHFGVRAQTTFTLHTDTSSVVTLGLLRDTDGDEDPDVTDPDDDNDGYTDDEELTAGTDPLNPDDHPTDDSPDGGTDGGGGVSIGTSVVVLAAVLVILLLVFVIRRRRSA